MTLLLQRDRQEISFSDEEGAQFHTHGSTADVQLRSIHNEMTSALGDWFEAADAGLANFESTMDFASDQDAESRVLEAMGKAFFVASLKAALSRIPVVGDYAGDAFDIVAAGWEEEQRAGAAGGQRRIAAFITSTRTQLSNARTQTREEHRNRLDAFLDSFPGDRTGRVLTEEQDAWLRQAKAGRLQFSSRIPPAAQFQLELTERFANTGGYVGLVTRGTWRRSGTLTLGATVRGSAHEGWSVVSVDDHWMLHTSAPEPDNVAQSLKDSLRNLGLSPLVSELPKALLIQAETESGNVAGKIKVDGALGAVRPYVDFATYERDPLVRQHRSAVMDSVGHSPAVATALLAVTEIQGSDR